MPNDRWMFVRQESCGPRGVLRGPGTKSGRGISLLPGPPAPGAGRPIPRLYIVERPEPNAFATGRDPNHAAVAVTSGILELMDDRELTGVLAHELSHVSNRDTLIGTIAATIAGAISFLAQMAQFQMWFGGGDEEDRGNIVGLLAAIILAPIA